MSFIRETIKNKTINKNKIAIRENKISYKKGFTIIEIMIVTALIAIITTSQVVVISRYMKLHRSEIKLSREGFYINEAFMIIEYQINSAKYIDVKNNAIVLRRSDDTGYDYIRKDRDSDIIISYGSIYSSTTNNIIKQIKDFKIERINNVLYLFIETKEGNLYKRCFGIERKRIKKDSS